MSDVFKLQYNGMTLAYPGWNGYVGWEIKDAYNLYLQQQIGGTITADKLSGIDGEIVTLSNTPDTGYQFNSYGITGAELSGNQFAFNGSDVSAQANFEEAVYTLTLQNDGHGTIAASKTTGHSGDTVTLSNTYNTYYRFNNYTVTGGTINGSTFTFGSQNATAKANFKSNNFTASGTFEQRNTNVNLTIGRGATKSTNIATMYAITSYKTSNVPTAWHATSNRWKPTNPSNYKITLKPILIISSHTGGYAGYGSCKTTGATLVGSTKAHTAAINTNGNFTASYAPTITSNTYNVNYGLSGVMSGTSPNAQYYTTYTAYNYSSYTTGTKNGTWTATGYAP